jgi:hypothetical protein
MKNVALFLVICCSLQMFSCGKESDSEKFRLLTGNVWASDSLLVNGVDASGPGELLENFKGDAIFNEDHTGTFGTYTGTWRFAFNESQLVISSESLPITITAVIAELTETSLKITTSYQIPPSTTLNLRMTFKAK